MALTKDRPNSNNGQLIIIKPFSRSKDGTEIRPCFKTSVKGEDGKWVHEENEEINSVTGTLTRIETKLEKGFKDDEFYQTRIFLQDSSANETYLLPVRFNIPTRGLINALLGLKSFEDITIKYFRSQKGYDTYYVSQGGEKVGWKYKLEELPTAKEVTFQGKTLRDYSDLDQFFISEIEALNARISGEVEGEELEVEEEPVEEVVEAKTETQKRRKKIQEEVEAEVAF